MNFNRVNNISGWIVFTISYLVYMLTLEKTVSFWDCGEFIATAYKLEVGHSPGAPLFMILGRLFGMFSSPEKVALFINSLSALASAFTILFLFWTITHFAKRLVDVEGYKSSKAKVLAVLGAGFVGALAYAFSDTFWFSAVEAEVYATSSFFTAIVFWAILKWEHHAEDAHADRWIVLISYLMGLSIGVHLLNLLTIPALAMVYYFRKYKVTAKGAIFAFIIGSAILGFVQFGLIQGVPILASKVELLFVNSFGMPLNSGAIFFLMLLAGIIGYLLVLVKRKGFYQLHLALLCVVFIMIGYSSYVTTIIRSNADVPIDMTNPDDVMSLVSYLQRDQYGAQPILTGPDFDSESSGFKKGGPIYKEVEKSGKPYYEQIGTKQAQPEFTSSEKRFFPRIWSQDPSHEMFYRNYLNLSEHEKPSGIDNYKFFFNYQLNWMWWRYFMWNYSGRQNDFQGTSYGEAQNGNWITGISFIDQWLGRGDISKMPEYYQQNKARNQYFMLPFILGIMGLVFQFNRNKKDGIIISLLFFFTGIAIVMFLNNTPQQPRERDYAYAGATYAFAIWIGLGVLMLINMLRKPLRKESLSVVVATLIALIAVPLLMAFQNWDDHDRSQKTLARSTAYNVLSSVDSNAILFVVGDNDTYPLWYMQEVEGFRTDVRVVNLSLLGIDWYIDQLNYKINDADAVPMIWNPEEYQANKRDFVIYREDMKVEEGRYCNLEEVLNFVTTDDRRYQAQLVSGDFINILPTKNFSVSVDKNAVLKNKLVEAKDADHIDSEITFTIPGNSLNKSELAILNILAGVAKEGWERPIYFSLGFPGGEGYLGLDNYIKVVGLANKLIPIKTMGSSPEIGEPQVVDTEKSLDLFLNKFLWGGTDRTDVYFDEKNKTMLMTYRYTGLKIAEALIREHKNENALQLLNKITKNITYESFPYDRSMWGVAAAYYQLGDLKSAKTIAGIIVRDNEAMLGYLLDIKSSKKQISMEVDGRLSLAAIQYMTELASQAGDRESADKWQKIFENFATRMRM